jgi:hypothetical protein
MDFMPFWHHSKNTDDKTIIYKYCSSTVFEKIETGNLMRWPFNRIIYAGEA